MSDFLYIVIKTGVYMQGIYGIWTSSKQAVDDAKRLIAEEADDYHGFDVARVPVDVSFILNPYDPVLGNPKVLYFIRREGKLIKVDEIGHV